jgi:hypothetical protein
VLFLVPLPSFSARMTAPYSGHLGGVVRNAHAGEVLLAT